MMELMMGPERFMMGGWWIIPMVCCVLMFVIFRFSGTGRPMTWSDSFKQVDATNQKPKDNSALDRLKMRLANGEISKSEYEELRQAIS